MTQNGNNRSRGRRLATGAIIGIAIACFLVLAFSLLCCYCCCFRKKRANRNAQARHRAPTHSGGMMGKLSGMMGGRNRTAGGPGMAEAGYGQQGGGYGYTNNGQAGYGPGYNDGYSGGIQQPQPAYR
ncbi:hypothetical protein VDGD_21185 [Verticillium dahliae]|nr:hypothetical protein VDGD_21185 [Verticillium dahliae]